MIGKILKTLVLGVSFINMITGASISNVFVESETSPTRYYTYNPPYGYTSVAIPYYSPINTLSGSMPVYTDPCVLPCIPGQTLTAVRPSANVVSYNSPYATVPVVFGSTNEEKNGYQYSYAVYDEKTGDDKAQRELSDGSFVLGKYSFMQPDGFIRKDQYVADDSKGFNAVVKNDVPSALSDTSQFEIKHNEHGPSCHDEKKSSLKGSSAEDLDDHSEQYTPEEQYGQNDQEHNASGKSHKGERKHSQERVKESKEKLVKASGESIEDMEEENSKEKYKKTSNADLQKKSKEVNQENSVNIHKESSSEESHTKHEEKKNKKWNEQFKEDYNDSVKNSPTSKEPKKQKMSEKIESIESPSEESKEHLKEMYRKPKAYSTESPVTYKIKSKKVSKENSDESELVEDSKEITNVHTKHKEAHDLVMSAHKVFVPYYDVVRCLQASLRKSDKGPTALSEEPSPLTYILLNKPC